MPPMTSLYDLYRTKFVASAGMPRVAYLLRLFIGTTRNLVIPPLVACSAALDMALPHELDSLIIAGALQESTAMLRI